MNPTDLEVRPDEKGPKNLAVILLLSSLIVAGMGWQDWQPNHADAWIAVGPEGDFSAEEVEWLHASGATPVHLGSLRLRTETAGMAAVAQFTTNQ